MRFVVLLVLGACGRVDFAPLSDRSTVLDARPDVTPGDGSPDALVDPSLRLHFTFDTSVTDGLGEIDATCTSCPSLVFGPRGTQAAYFGGNDCMYIVAPPVISNLTFALWMRAESTNIGTVFSRPRNGATTVENVFEIWHDSDEILVAYDHSPEVLPLTLDTWVHVAGTFDGTTLRAYLDGELYALSPRSLSSFGDDPYLIGCDIDSGVEFASYIGAVDDIRLYDRVLSDDEIAALAQ